MTIIEFQTYLDLWQFFIVVKCCYWDKSHFKVSVLHIYGNYCTIWLVFTLISAEYILNTITKNHFIISIFNIYIFIMIELINMDFPHILMFQLFSLPLMRQRELPIAYTYCKMVIKSIERDTVYIYILALP